MTDRLTILQGDCIQMMQTLPDESVHCCVTSPPYWGLRDYGTEGQLGLEKSPELYVDKMVCAFRAVRRVLRDDGSVWLNIGDSYWGGGNYRGLNSENSLSEKQASNRGATGVCQLLGAVGKETTWGLKQKDLVGIPWRVAFALQSDGWYLRQDIIWSKPNPMPESVTDRCTKSHEYLFMLSKSVKYYYDQKAIAEPSIYGVDDNGLASKNGNGGFKNAAGFEGKHGSMPTKLRVSDKQRGHSRRHDGFNDRWDKMEKSQQCSGTRNKRSVWTVSPANYPEAHFATYPPDLIKPCILAGCPVGGTVLDPFAGSGTTGMVSLELGRNAVLIELNPDYVKLIEQRCNVTPGFAL